MSLQQYTVTRTDLGTYTVQVVANDEKSAQSIVIDTLHEAVLPTPGLRIDARSTEAKAHLDNPQPNRVFKVTVSEIHDMEALIPAEDRSTAILQARRIISASGPMLDFDLADCRLGDDIRAVEVSR